MTSCVVLVRPACAEVTRTVVLEHVNAGAVEVSIPKLTQWINPDSVRVKGLGKATILEVASTMSWRVVAGTWPCACAYASVYY